MKTYQIQPKKENENKGYLFGEITEEQVIEHQKRSIRDILTFIESTNRFIHSLQTPEERSRSRAFVNIS